MLVRLQAVFHYELNSLGNNSLIWNEIRPGCLVASAAGWMIFVDFFYCLYVYVLQISCVLMLVLLLQAHCCSTSVSQFLHFLSGPKCESWRRQAIETEKEIIKRKGRWVDCIVRFPLSFSFSFHTASFFLAWWRPWSAINENSIYGHHHTSYRVRVPVLIPRSFTYRRIVLFLDIRKQTHAWVRKVTLSSLHINTVRILA